MTAVSNPFTMLHDALWSLAEAHLPLAALVKVGNRMKFGGADAIRDPIKQVIQAADLPELRLVSKGCDPHAYRDSSRASVVRRYEWQIATGDQRYDQPGCLYDVEWELLRALNGWPTVLGALRWPTGSTIPFVVHMQTNATKVSEGASEADLKRNINGWSGIWACEFLLQFPMSDIQPATA